MFGLVESSNTKQYHQRDLGFEIAFRDRKQLVRVTLKKAIQIIDLCINWTLHLHKVILFN